MIRQTAELDGVDVRVWIEQEPGSGGKESADATVRNLSGYRCDIDRVTGSKESRAYAYSGQVEYGHFMLIRAEWNSEFLSEHMNFPAGKYKDQVDAASGAFNKLAAKRKTAGTF